MIQVGFTPSECEVLLLIFDKHEGLVSLGTLPKLLVSNGEMSQIENKLVSGASLVNIDVKSEVKKE